MKTRKIPLRKCIACGENKAKKELLRVVKNKEEGVILDKTGRVNGRGAYICLNLKCLEHDSLSKKLSKALEIEIPSNIYEEIKATIESKEISP